MGEKILIVNADDFGIHEDVNHGIVMAFRKGIVRSTSLLVNMPAVEHAAQLAKDHPGLQVGVHLNISSGHCVAPARTVDQLVDSDGRFLFNGGDFPGSMRRLKEVIAQNPQVKEQIAIEFESQIEMVHTLGLEVEHINIHHYLSLIHPELFQIYVHAAESAHCAFRALCYPILEVMRISSNEIQQIRQTLQACHVPFPSYSVSNLLDGTYQRLSIVDYRHLMETRLRNLATRDDVNAVEIITHPAVLTPFVRENDSYLWARELETDLVTSQEFHTSVEHMNYRIAGYSTLLTMATRVK